MSTEQGKRAMKIIKLSPALRSAIYQGAKRCVAGSSPLFEAGYREMGQPDGKTSMNMRLWADNSDLAELTRLADLKELHLDDHGICELDLYATTTMRGGFLGHQHGAVRELETNVYVRVSATAVLLTTADACIFWADEYAAEDEEPEQGHTRRER